MKSGLTLSQLAAEIERQRDAKHDYVAQTQAIRAVATDKDVAFVIAKDHASKSVSLDGATKHAHRQLATHLKIPADYYDRMRADAPALLAENINGWLDRAPQAERRLVRSLDGRMRAFMSDGYRPLDNEDLAEAVLPVLLSMRLQVMSCQVTETRLYIKAVSDQLTRDVPTGRAMGDGSHHIFDTCAPAIIISNSEVGSGQLSVDAGVYTRACTNMALFADGGMKRRHVGGRHDLTAGEEVARLFTDKTKRATDRAIWLQLTDTVRGMFDEAVFDARCKRIGAAASDTIDVDPVKVVEVTRKRFGMSETEGGSVLQQLIRGGDLTRYGLHAAITRAAEEIADYDRATEFERTGAQVIDLAPTAWREIVADASKAEREKAAA